MTGVELEIALVHHNTYCTLYTLLFIIASSIIEKQYVGIIKQINRPVWRLHIGTRAFTSVYSEHHMFGHHTKEPGRIFFSYIFLGVFVYIYLCHPSEASTRYCVIPGGYPPQDWHSLPCAGEELDSNPGLLVCSQVRNHWATSPPPLSHLSSSIEPPLLLTLSHLSSRKNYLLCSNGKRVNWGRISRCQGEKGECKGDLILN